MLPLLAVAWAALQVPVDQPPRLRTVLPNGATILVERVPGAKSLVVDLFASSRDSEDRSATHGRRHLLEHLAALGHDGNLDQRLETAGGFLRARTLRECMTFEMTLPPDGLKAGLAAIREIATPSPADDVEIAREARLIEQEAALRDDSGRASEAAWRQAYGERGLDPVGNLEVIRATKTADLTKLHTSTFAARNLTVVVMGDVDLDQATNAVRDTIGLLPTLPAAKPVPEPDAEVGTVSAEIEGEARAVAVSGYRAPSTAATLAVALALASIVPDAGVTYTPGARHGLVILKAPTAALESALSEARAADLIATGRLLATRWVTAKLAEPAAAASLRGMLLSQERDLRPEAMIENLQSLDVAEYDRALSAFRAAAVVVRGR